MFRRIEPFPGPHLHAGVPENPPVASAAPGLGPGPLLGTADEKEAASNATGWCGLTAADVTAAAGWPPEELFGGTGAPEGTGALVSR